MAIDAFALLIGVAFVAAIIWPRPGWLALFAVIPGGIWWYLAYRDNVGADWQPGAELLMVTGSFAVVYWMMLVVGFLLGAVLRRAVLGRGRRNRPQHKSSDGGGVTSP
jgi:hypothetical protein